MPLGTHRAERYYLAAYIVILIRLLCENSNLIVFGDTSKNILTCVFALFMLLAAMTEGLTRVQWIAVSVLLLIFLYSYTRMGYFFLLVSLLCMVTIKKTNLKTILTWSCAIKASYLAIHVFCYIITYILKPDSIEYVYRDGTARHYFFVSHANTFSMFLLWTIIEYIYIRHDKLKIPDYLILLSIDLGIDFFTDSNSNRIAIVLLTAFLLIEKTCPCWKAHGLRWFVKYGYAILGIFFSIITIMYPYLNGGAKIAFDALDMFFTGRLKLGAYAYHIGGATFFGQRLPEYALEFWKGIWFSKVTCENTYIWMLVSNGIIYIILFFLLFFFTADYMSPFELSVCSIYILYSIMENYVINVVLCFAPLIAAKYVLNMMTKNFDCDIKKRIE